MPEPSIPSLRERKKVETWTAIHEAAASLALHHGLEQATVEVIAESAGVSSRTFFNYFPTKEDAVLGLREPVLDPDETKLTGSADLLAQVTLLLVSAARSALGGSDPGRRRELLQRYPHLYRRQMEYMAQGEALVCGAVSAALADDPAWSGGAEGFSAEETVRMLVMLAAVPAKFTATAPGFDPATGLTPAELAPALELFHHLQRTLS